MIALVLAVVLLTATTVDASQWSRPWFRSEEDPARWVPGPTCLVIDETAVLDGGFLTMEIWGADENGNTTYAGHRIAIATPEGYPLSVCQEIDGVVTLINVEGGRFVPLREHHIRRTRP